MAGRVFALILVLALVAFLTACGGRSSSTATTITTATPTGTPAPSMEELEAKLWAELDRLGIDPERAVAAAPSGAANGVFDLTATVIDPDGAGELPPTGVELTWTERLLADYNQDGQVNVSDLTPIGQYWDRTVSYDPASQHDGIPWWPAGEYDLDAANWRRARVDGNANGLIEAADITTIGQHWMEVLTGYRVYRKAPGSGEFVRLANPESSISQLTIARPGGIDNAGPVRYTFTDTPPGMGEYEYYVIGWSELTGHSSSEAETESNHVTATISVSLTDTAPPTWDDTIGITTATDNTDGTVTVEWGTATDIAVPPAPATPPVTYTLYYSTETPINFDNAGMIEGLTSTTWTSGKLVAGQEYHFAVRCRDSVNPPNEDTNANELDVTVTDMYPLHDWDPPVWTEVYTYTRPGENETEYTVKGIRDMEVGDGVIHITCGEAMDELSPPVHYDLYYLDLSKVTSYATDIVSNEGYEVIQDIPLEYDFTWPNRKEVYLCVLARDSAESPNRTTNRWGRETSPTNLEGIPIDMSLPGADQVDPDEFINLYQLSAFDRFSRTLFFCYQYAVNGNTELNSVARILAIDMEDGSWELDYEIPESEGKIQFYSIYSIQESSTGEVWIKTWVSEGDGHTRFHYRTTDGEWLIWEPPGIEGFWNGCFDHNGRPVYYVLEESDINPSTQYKLFYRWWDEENQQWHKELICDPGGSQTLSIVRPDGVTQLNTRDMSSTGSDAIDLYGHLFERSVDGIWTEKKKLIGKFSFFASQPYWGENWEWTGTLKYGVSPYYDYQEAVIYSDGTYTYLDENELLIATNGRIPSPGWPSSVGGYHAPPDYVFHGGQLCSCSYNFTELVTVDDSLTASAYYYPRLSYYACDKITGWYACIRYKTDYITANFQAYLYTNLGNEDMYTLDW